MDDRAAEVEKMQVEFKFPLELGSGIPMARDFFCLGGILMGECLTGRIAKVVLKFQQDKDVNGLLQGIALNIKDIQDQVQREMEEKP